MLVVQLQDDNGDPARARQDTPVVVVSSNSALLENPLQITIPSGQDYVALTLPLTRAGSSTLTALPRTPSQGLESSQVDFQMLPFPLVWNLTASSSLIYSNQTATITLTGKFLGEALRGLDFTLVSGGGILTPSEGVLGTAGTATATFTPTTSGSFNVTATGTSPQTGPLRASRLITVFVAPAKPPPTLLQQIFTYWYYLAAAVAAVLVSVFYIFRLRRKKQAAEIEAGFEVS